MWPGKPGAPDPYPWRFRAAPELLLSDADHIPAEEVKHELEHVAKWPPEHWRLAFQGQLRVVSEHDAGVLVAALGARAGLTTSR